MWSRTWTCAAAAALLWIAIGGTRPAVANLVIATPPGLAPGEEFRIVFVTDGTINATSSNISVYNTFVTNDAIAQAGGGSNVVTYAGTTLTWSAIASTPSIDAISNVGTTGAAVYLASGTLVSSSDDSSGLWATTGALNAPISQDLKGNTITNTPWTGTDPGGVGSIGGEGVLGNNIPFNGGFSATVGNSTVADQGAFGWVRFDGVAPQTDQKPLYGISQVLTVAGVPEPSSICLAALGVFGGIIMIGGARLRRPRS
jgi:hypothetical protein